ncbi:MAG: hypothetical protein AAF724_04165 [Pseudomonadota bacterium]
MSSMCRLRPFALASAVLACAAPALAQNDSEAAIAPCIEAAGTYLTTRTIKAEGGPDVVMRSLLSLTGDGQAFFTDSSQGGVLDYQPFSDGQGAWGCVLAREGTIRLTALILDFTFPNDADPDAKIARLDISADVAVASGEISGSTTIGFVALDGNPFDKTRLSDPIDYTFTGMKVEASR